MSVKDYLRYRDSGFLTDEIIALIECDNFIPSLDFLTTQTIYTSNLPKIIKNEDGEIEYEQDLDNESIFPDTTIIL